MKDLPGDSSSPNKPPPPPSQSAGRGRGRPTSEIGKIPWQIKALTDAGIGVRIKRRGGLVGEEAVVVNKGEISIDLNESSGVVNEGEDSIDLNESLGSSRKEVSDLHHKRKHSHIIDNSSQSSLQQKEAPLPADDSLASGKGEKVAGEGDKQVELSADTAAVVSDDDKKKKKMVDEGADTEESKKNEEGENEKDADNSEELPYGDEDLESFEAVLEDESSSDDDGDDDGVTSTKWKENKDNAEDDDKGEEQDEKNLEKGEASGVDAGNNNNEAEFSRVTITGEASVGVDAAGRNNALPFDLNELPSVEENEEGEKEN